MNLNLNPFYDYNAKVIRVVDGDTVDMEVDLGFSTSVRTRFRMYGINAPEMNTADGKAAKMYVQNLMREGMEFEINTIKDKKDKYGRYLVVVYWGGTTINEKMVEEGYAVEYMV